ncbi:MAG TPA: hypothetical protein VMA37_16250 [Acetobacteraceae bacterium]|nr:hypothetical protein [Acetobacteraceae bacterium]
MRITGFGIAASALLATRLILLPAQAETAPAASASWPHTITEPAGSVTVYQPQAVSWPDRGRLTARAAIAIMQAGQTKPILGTIEVSLATKTDTKAGIVALSDPTLLATHFPSLDTGAAAALQAKISAALPRLATRPVPLETVLLSLGRVPASEVTVNNDPPTIFYANRPASLVIFDGAPVMAPIGNTGLSFAVNTNWDVFADNGTWYLLNNGVWLSAPAATGPYAPVATLPAAFSALPDTASFSAARKSIPPHAPPPPDQVPKIFVSTSPAEIIVITGPPQFSPVAGTGLLRVTNTASTLFFDPGEGRFYVLLSGRWFASAGLDGPWSFATNDLPADFSLISPGGDEGAVLASVPGTVQAEEAVLKASIPTTATLPRAGTTPAVSYSGPPKFVPIPGTAILYAVNTDAQVLKIGEKYYACENGAWFVAVAPTGPWALADSLPPAIATIPPTSPLYNVTYVQPYAATPTTVTYGYTAGYLMGFVTAGVLVYGTGYYYPPVVLPGPVPIFYPYPYTYAANVWYNSATGAWARGGTVWGPYGAASAGRYYNPATGGWAQGAAVYGPYGGAGAWSYYNPHTGTYAHGSAAWGGGSGTANASFYNPRYGVSGSTNQNVDPYGRWGSSTVSGPNKTVNTQSRSNAYGTAGSFSSSTGAQGAGYHSRATGNSGAVVQGANGDVYAGRDGNVYQHTDNGWSKWNNGGWTQVQPPAGGSRQGTFDPGSYQQLQRDQFGRQEGAGRFGGGGRFAR